MGQGGITTATGIAACYAGLTRCGLVCTASCFHTLLHGTATEEQVAWRHVAQIKPEGQKGSGRGQVQPEIQGVESIEAG